MDVGVRSGPEHAPMTDGPFRPDMRLVVLAIGLLTALVILAVYTA